jgi:hypothetical protein
MRRVLRVQKGGLVYHALNRTCGRFRLFKKPGDYLAFLRVMAEAQPRTAREHPTTITGLAASAAMRQPTAHGNEERCIQAAERRLS